MPEGNASPLQLSFACAPYDRMLALFDGSVRIDGVELRPVPIAQPMEIFGPMLARDAFDIAEMSFTHCFVLRAQGRARFGTLPVFPSRMFRHGFIFINRGAGIRTPADLAGKRIGVQGFQMTAAVWIRGFLRDEYGVSFAEVEWCEGGVNETVLPGTATTSMHPPGLRVRPARAGETLSAMLADGRLDAIIGATIPESLYTDERVVRLFPNTHDVERAYFERTGIFPIMHGLVVRSELLRDHPWLGAAIVRGCEASKAKALDGVRFSGSLRYMLPWLRESLEEIDAVFGGDAWPYGVEPNQPTLAAFNRYLVADGFLPAPLPLESVFAETTERSSL
jgi:4,5-dihydroxyphthalate decarboxylase